MFGHFKRSYVIEKAYQIWRHKAGLDLKSLVSEYPIDRRVDYRNMLRDAQKSMAATEEEVAVLMILPFVRFLEVSSKVEVNDLIDGWAQQAKVRGTVLAQFKQQFVNT